MNRNRRWWLSRKVVIADAGPIIAFARLDMLALLPKIFERVYVTDTVVAESLAGRGADEVARIRAAIDNGFERIVAPDYTHLLLTIDTVKRAPSPLPLSVVAVC